MCLKFLVHVYYHWLVRNLKIHNIHGYFGNSDLPTIYTLISRTSLLPILGILGGISIFFQSLLEGSVSKQLEDPD